MDEKTLLEKICLLQEALRQNVALVSCQENHIRRLEEVAGQWERLAVLVAMAASGALRPRGDARRSRRDPAP